MSKPILSPFPTLGVIDADKVLVMLPPNMYVGQEESIVSIGSAHHWYLLLGINGKPFEQIIGNNNVEGKTLSKLSEPLLLEALEGVFVKERTIIQGDSSDYSVSNGVLSVTLQIYNMSSYGTYCVTQGNKEEGASLAPYSSDTHSNIDGTYMEPKTKEIPHSYCIEMQLPLYLQVVRIQQFSQGPCQSTEPCKQHCGASNNLPGDSLITNIRDVEVDVSLGDVVSKDSGSETIRNISSDIAAEGVTEMTKGAHSSAYNNSTRDNDVKDIDGGDDNTDVSVDQEAIRIRRLAHNANKEAYMKWKTQMDNVSMLFQGIAEFAESSGFTREELKHCYVVAGGGSSLPPLDDLDEDTRRFTESKVRSDMCDQQ